jgi:hypothetical protein
MAMTSSPFLGMDPFLEDDSLWPTFQQAFVRALQAELRVAVLDQYTVGSGERRYLVPTEQREEYVEIRRPDDGRLVTLLDVVSPTNKTTTAGRDACLSSRAQAKAAGASFVEIDLVIQGQPTWDYPRDGLPKWDYAVTVERASKPEQYEIWTATLDKRLPVFRVPLASDDRDTVLDLQKVFAACYEAAGFGARIDYRGEPPTFLSEENRRHVADVLRWAALRRPRE